MKHKTWFRLVLKAIGVLMMGMSLPAVVHTAFVLVSSLWLQMTGSTISTGWSLYGFSVPGGLVQFLFGMYLLFGGKWIVNMCIPSNRAYCPECGYDLSHARGERCPECGVVQPSRGDHET